MELEFNLMHERGHSLPNRLKCPQSLSSHSLYEEVVPHRIQDARISYPVVMTRGLASEFQ